MKGTTARVGWAMVALVVLSACGGSDNSSNSNDAAPIIASDPATTAELQEIRKPNTTSPQWVVPQHSPHSDIALVFVHGIFGDTLGTWENPTNGKHFYDLVAADPKLGPKVDMFAFGFPSMMLTQGSFTINDAANKLYNDLQYYGVLTYPHVVIVAHSMGGLVTLQALLTHRELLPKVPLLVFFSTPQEGAQITRIARQLLNNPALDEMLPADHNSYLQVINDQWRTIPKDQLPHIACAFEKLPIAGITIVPWSSASRFCDGTAVPVEADHIDIVKPADTNSESYITLSNALVTYAFPAASTADGGQGTLETPDFTVTNGQAVLTIDDPRGKRDVHIGNGGPGRLRYMLDQFPDSGLYVLPDIGPHYVDRDKLGFFSLVVGYESVSPTYHFVLSSNGGPALPVTVQVKNLAAIGTFHAQVIKQFSDRLLALYQSNSGNGAPTVGGDQHAIAEVAASVVGENYGNPPAAAKWLLSAQLLQSANWSREAVFALRQAEIADPGVVNSSGTLRLAAVAGYLSGTNQVFQHFAVNPQQSPVATRDMGFLSEYPNAFVSAEFRGTSAHLAELLAKDPSVADLGLGLQGDLASSAGNYDAAIVDYAAALKLRQSPSLSLRLANSQLNALHGADAITTLKRNEVRFPGPWSKLSTEIFMNAAVENEKKPTT